MILRAVTFAGALLVAPTAFAYDDPAVAICETVIKDSLNPNATYERVSDSLSGAAVTISYRTSVLNTRPVDEEHTCRFVVTEQGSFKLASGRTPERVECDAELAAFQANGSSGNRAALDACSAILQRELDFMKRELANRDLPLFLTGIYPIDADRTDLRAD